MPGIRTNLLTGRAPLAASRRSLIGRYLAEEDGGVRLQNWSWAALHERTRGLWQKVSGFDISSEYGWVVRTALIGTIILFSSQGESAQTPSLMFGAGAFLKSLFGGPPSDGKIKRTAQAVTEGLSGKPRTDFEKLGPGEEMVRDQVISTLLMMNAPETAPSVFLPQIFQRTNTAGGAMLQAVSGLLRYLIKAGTKPSDIAIISTKVAKVMGEETPYAYDLVALIHHKGWDLPEILTFLRSVKEHGTGKKDHYDGILIAMRELGPGLAGKLVVAFGTELPAAQKIAARLKKFGFNDEEIIKYCESVRVKGLGSIVSFLEHLEKKGYTRNGQTIEELISLYERSISALGVFKLALPGTTGDALLLDEMQQLDARVAAISGSPAILTEAVPIFEATYRHIADLFEDIDAMRTQLPSKAVLKNYALAGLIAADNLRRLVPTDGKRRFWEMILKLTNILPQRPMGEVFASYDPKVIEPLMEFFRQEGLKDRAVSVDADGTTFKEYFGKFFAAGLVDPLSSQEWTYLPEGQDFIHDILEPVSLRTGPRETADARFKHLYVEILHEYQRVRTILPGTPIQIIKIIVVSNVMKKMAADDAVLDKPSRDIASACFDNVHRGAIRAVASLPEEVLEKHSSRIRRIFPEAFYYRKGLEQEIDVKAIEDALRFPEQGEDLIMHIGVHNDLEFVKESLKHVSHGGKVVIVDIETDAFEEFIKDPVTSEAFQSGRLVMEVTDAFGEKSVEFRQRYRGQVERLYVLHPCGTPTKTLHDLVAARGTLIFQTDEVFPGSKYWLHRDLFIEGDFERLAGYTNGPAWFKTATAVDLLADAGIRFFVARRVRNAKIKGPLTGLTP